MNPTATYASGPTPSTKLTLLAVLCVLVLALLGGGCTTVPTGDGGTTRGLDVAKADSTLAITVETLEHAREVLQNAGGLDPKTDAVVVAVIDALIAFRGIVARSDMSGDGIIGGRDIAGVSEWLSFGGAVAMDLITRIALLGTIDPVTAAGAQGAPAAAGTAAQ